MSSPFTSPSPRLDVSTLSRHVERMKARGWLEVVPADDGRSQPFRLTPDSAGMQTSGQSSARLSQAQRLFEKVLGGGFLEQLNQAASRVSKGELPR